MNDYQLVNTIDLPWMVGKTLLRRKGLGEMRKEDDRNKMVAVKIPVTP
jgi:hypothetical protein